MYGYYPIISGVLLALAFPKFNLWPLAWFALVPFFFALNKARDWKESLFCGLSFGLVFFSINLFWVTSLFRFVGGWAVFGWVCLVVFQSLFIVLFSTFKFQLSKPFLIAALWVAIEWLRAWGPFGVTCGGVGYSQADFLPLIQIASFLSVYGVSFLVVLVNAYLAFLLLSVGRNPRLKSGELFPACRQARPTIYYGVSILILLAVIYCYGSWVLNCKSNAILPKLALIQPNIDQFDRMNPRLTAQNFDIQADLTRQASAEIFVWPETAVFSYLLRDPALFQKFRNLAKEKKAWLVVGTPHYGDDRRIFNSIISISPSGEVVSRYDKRRLVPFGEYLPFRPLLYPLLKQTGYYEENFDFGGEPQPIIAGKYKIAAGICFESTFPDVMRARAGDFMLVVTNDAWFGDSSAPYVHLNAGIFRAIENRKYFVQVGNTGFSAVIDPCGRVIKKSRLNEREVLIK